MAVEQVKAQLVMEIDGGSFKKAQSEVQEFARDVKVALDPAKLKALENTWADLIVKKRQAKKELDSIRQLYDRGIVDVQALKLVETSFNNISKSTTEANAKLQNYRNTGDETLSRFRNNFEKLGGKVDSIKDKLQELGKDKSTIEKYEKAVDSLGKEFESGKISAKKYQEQLTKLNNETLGATKTTGAFAGSLKGLGGILVGLFAVDKVVNFTKSVFNLTSQNQQLENSFVTLLGSEEKARNMLEQITSLADQSPFEKFDLANQTKKLIGYGFAGENAVNIMQVLGNTVSALGGGQDVMQGLVLALGQIQAKGKLSQEELNQFAERGVPAIAILTEKLGLTEKQLQNIGNEGIRASEAIPALLEGLQEKYLGALDKQSQTLAGRLSTITDSAKNEFASFGDDVLNTQNTILDGLGRVVEYDLPIILGGVGQVTNSVTELTTTIASTIDSVFSILDGSIVESGKKQLSVFDRISIGLSFLANGFSLLLDVIRGAFNGAVSIGKDLFSNFKVIGENIYSLFFNLGTNIGRAFGNIPYYAKSGLNEFLGLIEKTINNAIGLLNKIPGVNIGNVSVGKVNAGTLQSFKSLSAGLKELPGFANLTNTAIQETSRLLTNNENRFKSLGNEIDSIGKKTAKAFDLGTLDGLGKSLNNARKELQGLTIGSDEYIKKQKEINDLEEKFKKAIYTDKVAIPEGGSTGTGGSSGGGGKGTAEKQAKEELKIQEEKLKSEREQEEKYKKFLENLEKERNEKSRSSLKKLGDGYKDFSDVFEKQIKEAKDNIQNLEKSISDTVGKIKDLKNQLNDLREKKGEDLGSRNIEITQRLKEIEDAKLALATGSQEYIELSKERKKLLEEQRLILENARPEELLEAERKSKLSQTEKILEEYKIRKQALEEEKKENEKKLTDLEEQKNKESLILENFTEKKEELDKRYFEKSKIIEMSITDIVAQESEKRIDLLKKVQLQAEATANAMRSAGVNTGISTSSVTNNINVSQNVSSPAIANNYATALANQVTLANKGIK